MNVQRAVVVQRQIIDHVVAHEVADAEARVHDEIPSDVAAGPSVDQKAPACSLERERR
jgi:hypothetical protein